MKIKDIKRLIIYLGLLFLAVVLTYKLPYDSYSISQYIIPPIKTGPGGYVYLSGLLPSALYLIGIIGILSLERFANKSKLMILLVIIIAVVPTMKWVIGPMRLISQVWIDGANGQRLLFIWIFINTCSFI
jgi:hypothetical protein